MVQVKTVHCSSQGFCDYGYLAFPYGRMNYTCDHHVNFRNNFLVLGHCFWNSHQYNHKPELNGYIKYIGRRLNKLRNQEFFSPHPVIQHENHLRLIWTFNCIDSPMRRIWELHLPFRNVYFFNIIETFSTICRY